jgi:DNA-binding XRE family transcriptional regulator
MEVRKKLIRRRTELELTHDEVALKAEISRPYYTNIEAGRKEPSLKVVRKIAAALDTTVETIF